jgi:hypothetical protein
MAKMQLTPMTCTPHSDGWECVCQCGYVTHAKAGTAYHVCETSKPRAKPGLGDMVATGLSAVGITKERVQAVASAVGVEDCGCKKRQEALNNLGRKFGIG